MPRYPVPRLLSVAAALAAGFSLGGAWPSLAQSGQGGGHVPALPGLPSLPGVGGGGASPGGPIGGGLAGGVGGPSGALGGSAGAGSRAGGGGGGGGAISPLSPAANGGRHGVDGRGQALGVPDLSPTRPAQDQLRGIEQRGRDVAKAVERAAHGRGRDGGDAVAEVADSLSSVSVLTQARRQQAQRLIQQHGDVVEADSQGRPVVRGEILALAPSPAALAQARQAGFRVRPSETASDLGIASVVLLGPRGISAVEALRRLRALDPHGQYDFNHLYQASGTVSGRAPLPRSSGAAPSADPAPGLRIGLVDGSVAEGQPAMAGARLIQRAFARGGAKASAHATAVASLIAGRRGAFRGAAPGATLYVADVYGPTPAGGSADAIVRGLGWLAQAGTPVINISLVGPPNLLLEAAVKALIAKGRLVVAAVGNDGPAAPPLYPASYPGVVAVTGVDTRRRLLPEASRASHIDFAAPGSDMAAAGLDGGFVAVRGTSFAAPIAAGLLARYMPAADRADAARAVTRLASQAVDLGGHGPDPQFGRGLVGAELRTPPAAVQARDALRGP